MSPRHSRYATILAPALLAVTVGCRDLADPVPPATMKTDVLADADRPLAFRQVSSGETQTCGVTTTGTVYCWGGSSARPVLVPGGLAFRQVSAEGRFHACGVTTSDVAYCWGSNHLGQFGDGTFTSSDRPVRVAGGLAFRQVSAGTNHTCGITTKGIAYCWGHNQAGLGDGTTSGSTEPIRVVGTRVYRAVTAGEQFSCGLTTDDRAYCWGVNRNGELGIGTVDGPEFCFTGDAEPPCSTRPVRVIRGLAFRELDAGRGHVCGITRDNVAYCWGNNTSGELGHRDNTGPELCFGSSCSTRPVRVAGGLAFAGVSGGVGHTCGVSTSQVAYCWGSNESGQLGIGARKGPEACFIPFVTPEPGVPCSTKPVAVGGDHAFTSVEAGLRFSCAVKPNHVAFCWGANEEGQLGEGTTEPRLKPRRVASPS